MNPISLLNPWVLLGLGIAAISIATGSYLTGHSNGVESQKVDDQKQFDDINKKLIDQKTEANALYRKKQDENLALMADRDKLKNDLETHYAADQATTATHQRELATAKLQYRPAKGSGCGNSGGRATGTASNPAGTPDTTVLQLPDQITSDLRQLALDADNLKDSYAECYGWATKIGAVK